MTNLGPDWQPDAQGVPRRSGARMLIFDEVGNILLIRGHDTHDVQHNWWFTVGGGLEPGESPLDGAIRETREETGFVIDRDLVEGPVMYRRAEFRFRNVLARQDEQFFIARIPGIRPALGPQALTTIENETLDEFRWLSPEELTSISQVETVYPVSLPAHVNAWSHGWDGVVVDLADANSDEDGWVRDPDPM